MSNRSWQEKQLQWQKERELDFNDLKKLEVNRSQNENSLNTNYHLTNVTIKDNQYY